jgi:hypothetical protein
MKIFRTKYFTSTAFKQRGTSDDKIRTSCHFSYIQSCVIPRAYVRNLPKSATTCLKFLVRDSSVGIATSYGTDWSGDRTGGGDISYTRPDRPWGPSNLQSPVRISFPGIQLSMRGVDLPPLSIAEVKERVGLFFYFLSEFTS